MSTTKFGEFIRSRRVEKEISLREFAQAIGMDSGNLSKIERGSINPPQAKAVLKKIAKQLDLNNNLERKLNDLAKHQIGKYPEDVEDDLKNYEYIPLLLRTISNKKLTDLQIRELTKQINSK